MNSLSVHLLSDSIRTSVLKDSEELMLRDFPLHAELKTYLSEVNSKLAETKEKIDEVMIIFGVSHFKRRIRIVEQVEENSFKIDKNLLEKLTANTEDGFEIENEILSAKINGYIVRDPLNKEGSTLELTVYQTKVDKGTIDELTHNIVPAAKNIHFHTFPYVAFRSLSLRNGVPRAFIIVEVNNKDSTFTLVNGQNKIESTLNEKGCKFILDNIMSKMNVDEKVAWSLISMMNDKTLDQATSEKLRSCLDQSLAEWEMDMYKALHELSEGGQLPKLTYLIADSQWNNFFKDTLKHNEYNNFSVDDGQIEVELTDRSSIDAVFIENHLI